MTTEREKFESWYMATKHPYVPDSVLDKNHRGLYINIFTAVAFLAWQARAQQDVGVDVEKLAKVADSISKLSDNIYSNKKFDFTVGGQSLWAILYYHAKNIRNALQAAPVREAVVSNTTLEDVEAWADSICASENTSDFAGRSTPMELHIAKWISYIFKVVRESVTFGNSKTAITTNEER